MTTTYKSSPTTGTSRTTGISAHLINTLCHYGGSEIDNSSFLDAYLDLDIVVRLATGGVVDAPIQIYILYDFQGNGSYEDGFPGTNDGTAAASPVPSFESMVNSHGATVYAATMHWTVRGIPLLPFKYKIVVYNGTTKSTDTTLLTVLAYGRQEQTVG